MAGLKEGWIFSFLKEGIENAFLDVLSDFEEFLEPRGEYGQSTLMEKGKEFHQILTNQMIGTILMYYPKEADKVYEIFDEIKVEMYQDFDGFMRRIKLENPRNMDVIRFELIFQMAIMAFISKIGPMIKMTPVQIVRNIFLEQSLLANKEVIKEFRLVECKFDEIKKYMENQLSKLNTWEAFENYLKQVEPYLEK